jgi:nuclear pore complex protein Nup98-Nup96
MIVQAILTFTLRVDSLNESLSESRPARKLALEESQLNATDASILLSDISEVPEEDGEEKDSTPHPAGIKLTRGGYYTLPSLEDLAKLYSETRRCEVSNFTIGRLNYGNIYFDEPMDVAGLDLDDIGKVILPF